jgi:aspartyl-tRNA(Asn)/glutamyl-tRNA(Gln) amidotransferase subunit C
MNIDQSTVNTLAGLARLELTAEEKSAFPGQLASVLRSVEKLTLLDTEGVEPMVYAVDPVPVCREDRVQEQAVSREELFSLAPASADSCFLVPRILE